MGPYNGYSGTQRERKLRAQHLRESKGLPKHPPGPCSICNDPGTPLEAHDEDYSEPYLDPDAWLPPAQYALCHKCHSRLHARFNNSELWEAHKAHVRRGGYASQIAEFEDLRGAIRRQDKAEPVRLHHRSVSGNEWWELLTMEATTAAS